MPFISGPTSVVFTTGQSGSYNIYGLGSPQPTVTQTGTLPLGLLYNTSTGALSGTPFPGMGGLYNITINASNGVGPDASQNVQIEVDDAPAITSAANAAFGVGQAGSFQLTATGYPNPTFSETGALPTGLTFDSTTGKFSGTAAAGTAGSYPITITATNGIGADASQSLTLTVVNSPPTLTDISLTNPNQNAPAQLFSSSLFRNAFTDPGGASLAMIEIVSLPAVGTLEFDDTPVVVGQQISLADIDQFGLFYSPPNQSFLGTVSFAWNGSDGAFYANSSALVTVTYTQTATGG